MPSTSAAPAQNGIPSSSAAAWPPNSPTSASQAIDDSHCTAPGRTIVFPNGSRASGTWPVPVSGPQVHSAATGTEPMTVPRMMAASPAQNPSPSSTASVPANTPDSSMFGVNHKVNIRYTPPYRPSAGMGAIPWLSSARSPGRLGRTPSKTLSSSTAPATAIAPFAGMTRIRFLRSVAGQPPSQPGPSGLPRVPGSLIPAAAPAPWAGEIRHGGRAVLDRLPEAPYDVASPTARPSCPGREPATAAVHGPRSRPHLATAMTAHELVDPDRRACLNKRRPQRKTLTTESARIGGRSAGRRPAPVPKRVVWQVKPRPALVDEPT